MCYGIIATLIVQMFAVVNQRRYRSAFWLSFATLLLSILLCVMAFTSANIVRDAAVPEENGEEMKALLTRQIWIKYHYLIVLPVIALLQIVLFTKRPPMLFEKKAAVKA